MTRTYVTVAIPYVNAAPHLGYAYELVQADVFARSRRRVSDEVRFLGGTDDYSLKNVLAAAAAGSSTRAFVDRNAARFEELARTLRISFDDFIRTSADPRHAPAVERLWHACAANGDLYRRTYEGEYCVGCERFYDPSELVRGQCPEHGTPTERVAEENWFFRLSRYREQLERAIVSGALAVQPEPFRQEVLAFVRGGLEDISVSRSVERARGWGIGVPDDPSQVVYVWFDALANYISALRFGEVESGAYRRWWIESDERIHVIGKGILRFHAVYWPAFLASANEPLPTRVQVHPYLTVDGAKLSKSSGHVVDPDRIVDEFGVDAIRWWFAREVGSTADTDFTFERLIARANEDLANGLGNVTNRIGTLVHRCRDGVVPDVEAGPIDAVRDLERDVTEAIAAFDLRRATQLIAEAVTALNRHLEESQPWLVAKAELADPNVRHSLNALLARQVTSVRIIAGAVAPIVPLLSDRLLAQLDTSPRIPKPTPAFRRIESTPADG